MLVLANLAGFENDLLSLHHVVLLDQLSLRSEKTLALPPIGLRAHWSLNTL